MRAHRSYLGGADMITTMSSAAPDAGLLSCLLEMMWNHLEPRDASSLAVVDHATSRVVRPYLHVACFALQRLPLGEDEHSLACWKTLLEHCTQAACHPSVTSRIAWYCKWAEISFCVKLDWLIRDCVSFLLAQLPGCNEISKLMPSYLLFFGGYSSFEHREGDQFGRHVLSAVLVTDSQKFMVIYSDCHSLQTREDLGGDSEFICGEGILLVGSGDTMASAMSSIYVDLLPAQLGMFYLELSIPVDLPSDWNSRCFELECSEWNALRELFALVSDDHLHEAARVHAGQIMLLTRGSAEV